MDETNPAAFGRPEYGTGLEIHPRLKLEDTLKDIAFYEEQRKALLEPESDKLTVQNELQKIDRELGMLNKMADHYRRQLGVKQPDNLHVMPPAKNESVRDNDQHPTTQAA